MYAHFCDNTRFHAHIVFILLLNEFLRLGIITYVHTATLYLKGNIRANSCKDLNDGIGLANKVLYRICRSQGYLEPVNFSSSWTYNPGLIAYVYAHT